MVVTNDYRPNMFIGKRTGAGVCGRESAPPQGFFTLNYIPNMSTRISHSAVAEVSFVKS